MLEVKNLTYAHPAGIELFEGLSFSLPEGAFLLLLGANGSGKTTLLDILAGLLSPSSGEVILEGSDDREVLMRQTAFLPQEVDHYLLGATVREELEIALYKGKEPPQPQEILEISQRWELSEFCDTQIENLSVGQKKRLALAGALAKSPRLILLDEPFSGLDWNGSLRLLKDLENLKKLGRMIILVTHEPSLVEKLADYFLLIKVGKKFLFTANRNDLEVLPDYGVRPLAWREC
ncbi:MAG: energy-coupling factor ABC transporter ATP-binding protein [Deltaproteobacteria bacterium]|jgi:biotin transport system ATP-binding protein|nr:energy-coupling factor ABC transporter ATP-binding protein [Deltaproteobacteria bacterium]